MNQTVSNFLKKHLPEIIFAVVGLILFVISCCVCLAYRKKKADIENLSPLEGGEVVVHHREPSSPPFHLLSQHMQPPPPYSQYQQTSL
jgi:NADH:ubiquinone oxidoreductase subunit 3 (subunit A)